MAVMLPAGPDKHVTQTHFKENDMPYVNIKITREGSTTSEQKAALIHGVTKVLVEVLDKSPADTFVVVDEVEMENWGIGGLPVEEYRSQRKKPA